MTKEELSKAFNAAFIEPDKSGKPAIKGTARDIINWIADQFCNPGSSADPPFSKAFTGMLDKNRRPIHEGDHIRLYYKGEYVICQVVYDLKHAAFLLKWPDGYINQYFMNGNSYEVVGDL
ncbi:MAG: hypothetical protein ACJ76F_01880 [Bacteroidia bacterium]